ncbi:carboxylesterase family protein [Dysgonomonas macrotermitis]|uniref:Phospholipase/Carboxylesterase n=1 Tax=Dysgonomonas macrotermitis TaxID=1346286 RepID=A0A1M5EGW2_9BACT|nr:alpha/beta hydrolase-fold protein [Dysgonomonas macrotermitis]SHF78469.1 Phospholipase/Carboxylesterase [Dysgonomonas macrotermitis]
MRKVFFSLVFLLVSIYSFAQFTSASYMSNGFTLPYQVMFPQNYDESKAYPLVILLHGAGERGNDNEKQLTHGKQFLIDNFQSTYPAIVIAPQCPLESYWSNVERHQVGRKMSMTFGLTDQPTAAMSTLMNLIQNWVSSGSVNTRQVYIGGLSMGGMGTLELLWRMPQTFTAAFAICGGSDLDKLPVYAKHTPLWLFHGDADVVVSVNNSRNINKRLLELGGEVKYTEYPGVNHNSWENAFQEKELASWLFQHKK